MKPCNIRTLDEFLAHALAIEREAAARYLEFADQMLTHNNHETAALFERLAHLESEHHSHLQQRARSQSVAALKPWEYRWIDPESPEATPIGPGHYLMTPHHALRLALANEERARDFFAAVADAQGCPEEVRRMAREFADDEGHHVAMIVKMLEGVAVPADEWGPDLDPPMVVD